MHFLKDAPTPLNSYISISYTAIDKVRYPSKFGGYPLPSPDDPLRLTGSVSNIPPSREDIERYYHEFDDYELLDSCDRRGYRHRRVRKTLLARRSRRVRPARPAGCSRRGWPDG